MKLFEQFLLLGVASMAMSLSLSSQAQTNLSTSDSEDRSGRIVSFEQVNQELRLDYPTLLDILRAERPEYPKLSDEVRTKLLQFKRARDRYLLEQEELIKKFKGATEAERERIRELLRDRRALWLERSRSFRESSRERFDELVRELPKHREALEAARETAREQAREIRQRPGVD